MSIRTLTAASRLEIRAKSLLRTSPLEVLSLLPDCFRVYRERRRLLALDDRMLKDIGVSRGEAYAEASRSVFDLPARRHHW